MDDRGEIFVFSDWYQFELAVTELAESGDGSLDAACAEGCIAIKVNGLARMGHGTVC